MIKYIITRLQSHFRINLMKIGNVIFPILMVYFLLPSCDEIDEPYAEINYSDTSEYTFPVQAVFIKKVLIEEFTGHKCTNCPQAHAILQQLIADHPNSVIPVAFHTGQFANTDSNYPDNYKTDIGDAFYEEMGTPFMPVAMIDRGDTLYARTAWEMVVQNNLQEPVIAGLQVAAFLENNASSLRIYTLSTLQESAAGNYNLGVYLVEDSLVSPQLDNGNYVAEYLHRNVFRFGITGISGIPIQTDELRPKKILKSFLIPLRTDWNPDQLYVVVFLRDPENNTIIQAEICSVE